MCPNRHECHQWKLATIFLIITNFVRSSSDFGVPIEIQLWDTGRTPLVHMVDVTNQFGLKVLAEHNFLNDNNIAFSPYGLTGIMIALYEGIDGESSYQMQRGMQLPWNRNVMRVGFRDIHRTLKTYFVPEEGFLAGLALNNENVTFNDSYKKILRFYGFDLEKERPSKLPPQPGNMNVGNNNTGATNGNDGNNTGDANGIDGASTTMEPPKKETIPAATKEDTNQNTEITTEATTMSTPEPTTEPAAELLPTTEVTTAAAFISSISTAAQTSMQTEALTETMKSTPDITEISSETTTLRIVSQTNEEPTSNNEVDTSPSSETSTTVTTSMTSEVTTTAESESTTSESSIETLARRKKSVMDFIYTNPPYVDEYLIRTYNIPPERTNNEETLFLVNGVRNVQVTYMQYDTVLEHAYLPHLEASALRLPLDSDRYYLLIILPLRGGPIELGQLIARMARQSDLRDVQASLRPRRVRAIVPSFTVKGHITLTTDLQKLGIRDVFEPRQYDFTPMTAQSGVYVRSIEQAVSVAIRKYRPDDTKMNSYSSGLHPVQFSATYPFVYFVMDASIHVALMAGKMVDPLNSRIL